MLKAPELPMTTKTVDAAVRALAKGRGKDEVRALLDRLPDDVSLEDIQYHLDVVVKVLEAEADPSPGIPHEEVFRRLQDGWPELDAEPSQGFTDEDFNRRVGKSHTD
jgi:hypothetical protein